MWKQIRQLFTPPIFEDVEKTRVSYFMTHFSWISILVLLSFILIRTIFWRDANSIPTLTLGAIILTILGIQVLVNQGQLKAASWLSVFIPWASMTCLAWYSDGVHDLAVIAYIVIIMLASLLSGWRFALLIGGMSITAIWFFAVMEQLGFRQGKMDAPLSYAFDLTGIYILIGATTHLLITGWTRSLHSARLEVDERLNAEGKLQRQADYLSALHETSLGILNQSELLPILDSVLTRVCELIGTEHGQIELVLPDGSALKQHLGQGILSKFDGALTHKGEGVAGQVWVSGQTLVINDYARWENALPGFISSGIRSVLGVPLKLGGDVSGVLAVSFAGGSHTFTEEQVNLAERFAALAAVAIHNSRLNEQVKTELQERRAAELELSASEERFRKVFQASPVAICIASLEEGRLLDANDAFWRISGFDPTTSIGRTTLELKMLKSAAERREFVERLKREPSMYDPDDNFVTPAGEQRSAHTFNELIEIKGQPCVLTMLYDVTDQMQVQNALKDAESRTHALLAAIPDMIFEITISGEITGFIPSTEINPLLPAEQFLGKNIRDLFPSDISKQTLFAIERALETDQLHAFEYSLPAGAGLQFYEARVSAISSNLAMIMVRDISQRKWIESEREKLILELEDKNAELERFTYTVSHDLKSPLITIKGFLGFLEQDAVNDNITRLRSDIKRISDATDKMQSLLNELLELSRVGRVRNPYEQIPFEEIAQEAVELVQGRLLNAQAEVRIQKGMPVVFGDRRRLLEVLQNLIDNAAKFFGDQPQPGIEIGQLGEEDGKPIFFVRDNGVGIEAEHLDRIWGLFNKLSPDSEGTGIGLTLVRRIIEIHHGRIWVESEPGKGSTFYFTLQTGPEN